MSALARGDSDVHIRKNALFVALERDIALGRFKLMIDLAGRAASVAARASAGIDKQSVACHLCHHLSDFHRVFLGKWS